MDPSAGELIAGRYLLEERVGAGASGVVHRAHDRESSLPVAIKFLRSTEERDELRFEREFAMVRRLDDPTIVRTLSLHRDAEGALCLVMEWLNGESLRDRLVRCELTIEESLHLMMRMVRALCVAHGHGVVHRDLTPSNIFLVDGRPSESKLFDFRFSRPLAPGQTLTQLGELLGTPGYVAPELLRGERVDEQSDLYALGCVMFRCLSGKPVFEGTSDLRFLFRAAQESAPSLQDLKPDLPKPLTASIDRLLRREAIDRPRSADEVLQDLELSVLPAVAHLFISKPLDYRASPADDRPASPVLRGDIIADKYKVGRVIAQGGMGVVVEGYHQTLDQRVAIKFLLPLVAQKTEAIERFLREAQSMEKIVSDHVVRVFEVGAHGEVPYIVMEYLEGVDLGERMRQKSLFTVEEAVDIALQALEGLTRAHAAGIVHRDLKPSNLFLTAVSASATRVKVLDFGISKIMPAFGQGDAALTSTTSLFGSPGYMSPEQVRSTKSVDLRTDVWSMGVILYEMLTGEPAFPGESIGDVFAKIREEPLPPLRVFRPDVSPDLENVIMRCLQRDREQRFDDAGVLLHALGRCQPNVERERSPSRWAEATALLTAADRPSTDPVIARVVPQPTWSSLADRSVRAVERKYEDEECSIVMEMRSPQLIVTRVRGHARQPFVDFYLREFMAFAERATHRMDVFHDWEKVTGFEPEVRQTFMRWGDERREHNKKLMRGVHTLAGSTMVFLALGAASIIYGNQLYVYRLRESFETALRNAEEWPSTDPIGS